MNINIITSALVVIIGLASLAYQSIKSNTPKIGDRYYSKHFVEADEFDGTPAGYFFIHYTIIAEDSESYTLSKKTHWDDGQMTEGSDKVKKARFPSFRRRF